MLALIDLDLRGNALVVPFLSPASDEPARKRPVAPRMQCHATLCFATRSATPRLDRLEPNTEIHASAVCSLDRFDPTQRFTLLSPICPTDALASTHFASCVTALHHRSSPVLLSCLSSGACDETGVQSIETARTREDVVELFSPPAIKANKSPGKAGSNSPISSVFPFCFNPNV